MLFFNNLLLKLQCTKLYKFFFGIFLFLLFFIPNVDAATFEGNGRDLKYFDSNNIWVNFASATSFNGYQLSWNSEYGVYYTNSGITTGTYGGGFAGTITLVPGQYYNILYATSKPGTACGNPNNWNTQFKAGNAINSSATQRAVVDRAFVSAGYVTYTVQDDYLDACYYAVTFHVTQVTDTLILPFNSSGSSTGIWSFYGFNLENLGSIDSLSSSDLDDMQTALQSSITNMTNSINNNISSEFDDLKDLDHSYNSNPKDTPSGSSDINSTLNKQDQLSSSLNLDSSNVVVTLNTNATTFIWGIVDRIRAVDSRIVLLFTTVLSLGIIKMILNR